MIWACPPPYRRGSGYPALSPFRYRSISFKQHLLSLTQKKRAITGFVKYSFFYIRRELEVLRYVNMKQPFWKHIASYLYEFRIEAVEGQHNPYLEVVYSRGRYRLDTENAIYSYEDLYTNFYYSFRQIKLHKQDIKNVLILGLGLGSIPLMLERDYKRKYHYTAIEIDEEVLYLANKYALHELQSPIEVLCADARLFVKTCTEKYDLVCMDIFLDDVIPSEFEQTDFLENLKTLIAPNGLLLYNRLFNTHEDKAVTAHFYEAIFSKTFPDATFLNVDGNWVLLNRKI